MEKFKETAAKLRDMNADQLKQYAADNKVDVSKAESADDVRQLLLEDAENKLSPGEKDQLRKARLDEADAQDRAAAAKRKPDLSEVERTVVRINLEFCRDIPQSGRGGTFTVEKNDPRFGGDYAVPNGTYRVAGSDWLYTFRGGRFVSAHLATPENRWGGEKVISVNG